MRLVLLAAAMFVIAGVLWVVSDGEGVDPDSGRREAGGVDEVTLLRDGSVLADERDLASVDGERRRDLVRGDVAAVPQEPGTVRVAVVDRASGHPIAGAETWVIASPRQSTVSDRQGLASFEVPPGEYWVGCGAPEGGEHFALAFDVDSGERASDQKVVVEPGGEVDVRLKLHRGATVRGRIVDGEGRPVSDLEFVRMWQESSRWVDPTTFETDAVGYFEWRGLRPGSYLIGPDPDGVATFPLQTVIVPYGATRDVELVVDPVAEFTVRVVDFTTGGPLVTARPLQLEVRSRSGLGDMARENPHGLSRVVPFRVGDPATCDVRASRGRYWLRVMPAPQTGETWLATPWSETVAQYVRTTTKEVVIETSPKTYGPLERIDVQLTRAVDPEEHWLTVHVDNDWPVAVTKREVSLAADHRSFRVVVDRAYAGIDTLVLQLDSKPFAKIELSGADQVVTVTPPVADEADAEPVVESGPATDR